MEPSFVPGCISILLGFESVKLSISGDANHDSSLPVPEPVCVCLCVFARRQVRRTGRRQTGRSDL